LGKVKVKVEVEVDLPPPPLEVAVPRPRKRTARAPPTAASSRAAGDCGARPAQTTGSGRLGPNGSASDSIMGVASNRGRSGASARKLRRGPPQHASGGQRVEDGLGQAPPRREPAAASESWVHCFSAAPPRPAPQHPPPQPQPPPPMLMCTAHATDSPAPLLGSASASGAGAAEPAPGCLRREMSRDVLTGGEALPSMPPGPNHQRATAADAARRRLVQPLAPCLTLAEGAAAGAGAEEGAGPYHNGPCTDSALRAFDDGQATEGPSKALVASCMPHASTCLGGRGNTAAGAQGRPTHPPPMDSCPVNAALLTSLSPMHTGDAPDSAFTSEFLGANRQLQSEE
jgi:hypothetical protein